MKTKLSKVLFALADNLNKPDRARYLCLVAQDLFGNAVRREVESLLLESGLPSLGGGTIMQALDADGQPYGRENCANVRYMLADFLGYMLEGEGL